MMLLLSALALAELRIDPEPSLQVESTVTLLDDSGRPRTGIGVRVLHRVGLAGESQASLGLTDSLGRVRWQPEAGGITTLRAGDEERTVVVSAASPPATTSAMLIVMTLAGLLATGFGWIRRRTRARSYRTRH